MKKHKVKGELYSLGSFEETIEHEAYAFRAKVKITTIDGEYDHFIDVYTTNTDKKSVEDVLLDKKSDSVTSLQIIHWASKAQDDATSKFLDEWLKEDKNEKDKN